MQSVRRARSKDLGEARAASIAIDDECFHCAGAGRRGTIRLRTDTCPIEREVRQPSHRLERGYFPFEEMCREVVARGFDEVANVPLPALPSGGTSNPSSVNPSRQAEGNGCFVHFAKIGSNAVWQRLNSVSTSDNTALQKASSDASGPAWYPDPCCRNTPFHRSKDGLADLPCLAREVVIQDSEDKAQQAGHKRLSRMVLPKRREKGSAPAASVGAD